MQNSISMQETQEVLDTIVDSPGGIQLALHEFIGRITHGDFTPPAVDVGC